MNEFVIYSKDACPYCERAKAMVNAKGDKYSENKLGVDFDRESLLEMFPDARTFPIILKLSESGAQRIGGFEDLVSWYNKNKTIEGLSL